MVLRQSKREKKLKYLGFGSQLGQIFKKGFTIRGVVVVLRHCKRERKKLNILGLVPSLGNFF